VFNPKFFIAMHHATGDWFLVKFLSRDDEMEIVAQLPEKMAPWDEKARWALSRSVRATSPPSELEARIVGVAVRVSDRYRVAGSRPLHHRKHPKKGRGFQYKRRDEEGSEAIDSDDAAEDEHGGSFKVVRLALCFFGLNRSLKWTSKSILENIVTPLEAWVGLAPVTRSTGDGSVDASDGKSQPERRSVRQRARRRAVDVEAARTFDVFFHDYSLSASGANARAREVDVALGSHPAEEAAFFLETRRLARYSVTDQVPLLFAVP